MSQPPRVLRVLIVDDSATVRAHLRKALSADPGFTIVGEAVDGESAIALCRSLRPDVVTLDMVLPRGSGLFATEQIMAHHPTPILIVSSSANRGELFDTYEALAAGAVDILEKPLGDEPDEAHDADSWSARYRAAVRMVARIRVITHPRALMRDRLPSAPPAAPPPAPSPAIREATSPPARVIGIGASTGGPAALRTVLSQLPPTFPLPILVVVHLASGFDSALADWLATAIPFPISVATDGMPLPRYGVVLAPPDRHLVLQGDRLRLLNAPPLHSCRPSVDHLFGSMAELGPRGVGVLLTGMGKDGAAGLLAMRRQGALTIAQDEATSTVYGMPREAHALGAAVHVLPLDRIAAMIATTTPPPEGQR